MQFNVKKCLVIVEHKARDEFKWCSCRTLGVERTPGNNSRYFAMDEKKKVWLIKKMVGSPPTSLVNICR